MSTLCGEAGRNTPSVTLLSHKKDGRKVGLYLFCKTFMQDSQEMEPINIFLRTDEKR